MNFKKCFSLFVALALLLVSEMAIGQALGFGRNKPVYDKFDFEVLNTPNFEIYHYLENHEAIKDIADWSEQWHRLHQAVLRDTIVGRNPMVLYNNHADFQQTNTISGSVGVGTGGVTEAFKNRVIYPYAMSNQQTHHVLGHELVHAFQYNMILRGDSTNIQNLSNLPLWMVEGLAEYLSIGRVDAHTAMWMRDAVLQDDVPTIKQLNNPKYFPYRYGQMFWAFTTGLLGDGAIAPYFTNTAKYGFENATLRAFGMKSKNVSDLWVKTLKDFYTPQLDDKKERTIGDPLISQDNSGRMNIAPVISPNGRYVAFLSEKNLASIDLFLADARTGEVIRTLSSSTKDTHIDDYNYIESAGAWSPNSKQIAIVGVSKGDNILVIKDIETGKTADEFKIDGVPAFSNPTWSPDNKSIVVAGLVDGQVDLYQVNLRSKKVTQLTDDKYSELLPNWSPDGRKIVFATDEWSFENGRTNGKWTFNLAELDVDYGDKKMLNIFLGANNLNPVYDNQGDILFLSDRDGFRNMYKYESTSGRVFQMTDLLTGISGITKYAPAISATRTDRRDRIVYSHYWKNGYNIYRGDEEEFLNQEVDPNAIDMTPAILPKVVDGVQLVVDKNLDKLDRLAGVSESQLEEVPYKPKFKLDFINGSTGVGVGNSNLFGTQTGAAGGINAIFSDILGNNQLFASAALNGEIADFGGIVSYLNRKNRIAWGVGFSHLPFRSGRFLPSTLDNLEVNDGQSIPVIRDDLEIRRVFEDRLSVFAQLPLSKTLRLEAGAAYSFYYDRVDILTNYYQALPVENTFFRGAFIGQERERVEDAQNFNLNFFTLNAALVGDNSFFGITSPIKGSRYRLGVSQFFGGFNLTNITADYRKYVRLQPFTLAFQVMHEGRYGEDADQIFPFYIGYPWNVRGYNNQDVERLLISNNIDPNILLGSKGAVAKFEVRIPFTGPEQLSLFKSKFLLSELAFFADAGIAWNDNNSFNRDNVFANDFDDATGEPIFVEAFAQPLTSIGASLRVNLFGALIVEPFYAIPLLEGSQGRFGINFLPGW